MNHKVVFRNPVKIPRLAQTGKKITRYAMVFAQMTYDMTSFKIAQKLPTMGRRKLFKKSSLNPQDTQGDICVLRILVLASLFYP